ncbi:nickel ABC transporter substrate-binding protein [Halomonas dongshanensis]|uniref:Nickel ABC transporter substrate-binding protein n=1 Tax=Halomonas dongshanensis TaxID=2890835 RepID=A0ABT2EH66_9GAMM|nr:nickel ABC transporter substrate-binding protein [Halomonas dongshanensis]MCS2610890.1 nickel ABC transporter substrate-binding protein [Halomonas dongshanensis]
MRSLLKSASIVALVAGLAGPAAAETLGFSWPVNVGPLNPHLYSPNQMFAQVMVFEPLVKYQEDGSLAPWLASAWEISEDGRTYEFTLRDDVTFSNGEPFDAEAVVANFDAILANRERHAWLELTNQIQQVEVIDEHHVRLTLQDSYYPLLQDLSLPRPFRFVAPSQLIDGESAQGITAPIGTGPWVLADTRLGEYDHFVRNEHYWGEKPALEGVNISVIPDPNTRAIAFQTGGIDLIYGVDGPISPDTFQRFEQMGQFTTEVSDPIATQMLAINSQQEATRDQAVREAINHAIDKQTMVDTVFYGTQPTADALFSPTLPYADVPLAPYAFDPELARQLLEGAGWRLGDAEGVRQREGARLSTDLVYVGNDAVSKSMAEIIQADLARVGIETRLIGEEESSVYARQRDGRFGMIFNRTWGAPSDPHAFISSMRVPAHADYQAQLGLDDKADIDAMISDILTTTGEERRRELYTALLTRLHESAIYVPLTYTNAIAVARPELGPIPFGAMASEIPFERIAPQGQ